MSKQEWKECRKCIPRETIAKKDEKEKVHLHTCQSRVTEKKEEKRKEKKVKNERKKETEEKNKYIN